MPHRDPRHPDPSPIAFIGGGNMARSLIGGLVATGRDAGGLRVSEPHAPLREGLAADFGVPVYDDNLAAARGAGTWVLAVKPQVLREVCVQLAPLAQAQRPVVVSIAAGITTAQLERWLGGGIAVVRCMPNTPALIGDGITGLYATAAVDAEGRDGAQALLGAVGRTVWIDDEALMDAVTAVSGSGPAYFFLMVEALQAAGEARGLPAQAAHDLAVYTAVGAARMLAETGESPAVLRQRVTSPGGTTQAALEAFEAGGFRALVDRAVVAATVRGGELSAANDA